MQFIFLHKIYQHNLQNYFLNSHPRHSFKSMLELEGFLEITCGLISSVTEKETKVLNSGLAQGMQPIKQMQESILGHTDTQPGPKYPMVWHFLP